MRLQRKQIIQIVIDAAFLLLLGIPLLLIHLLVKPFQSGFFCSDETIQYPYKPDTISMGVCAVTWILPGIAVFVVVEFIYGKRSQAPWVEVLWNTAKVVLAYLVGAGVNTLLSEVGKLTVGRLRPHFIDVCSPDFSKINCSRGYITEFTCLNLHGYSDKIVDDSRKSFPSGHSSFSVYSAFFIAFYCQQRLRRVEWSVMLKIFLQTAAATYAVFVLTSRVTDFKHHWSDVAAGALQGLLVGFWMVLVLGQHISYFGHSWWTKPEVEKSASDAEDGAITTLNHTSVPFKFSEKPDDAEIREMSASARAY